MLRTCYPRSGRRPLTQVGDLSPKVASAVADGKSELILIIVESILSLPSATRPDGQLLRNMSYLL
ncbi:MAG: hypothetical protein LBB88_04800 [Planctomycetaceae bacterium]|nr:hypothetical protein [Planctomycetaceae bacterium]